MKCPKCQRETPEGSERCDCGYLFVGGPRGLDSVPSTDVVAKRSKLMPTGVLLTILAVGAIAGKGMVYRQGEGGPLLIVAALLDLISIVLLPAGVICWILGALRDRRAKKTPASG